MKKIFVLLLIIFSFNSLYAESYSNKAKTFFKKGLSLKNTQSSEKYFELAIKNYKLILNNNIKNGFVYYNIGNCYFYLKKYGNAILYYRKAQKYIPTNKNLIKNLKLTISKIDNKIKVEQSEKLIKLLFFYHYIFSLKTKTIILFYFTLLIFILQIIKLFKNKNFLNWVKITLMIFSIIFLGSIIVNIYDLKYSKNGVIIKDSVVARKGDSINYEPAFEEPLNQGIEFKILEKKDDWLKVKLENGSICWLNKNFIGII